MLKRFMVFVLCLVLFCLAGCSPIGEVADNIFPPKPSGELYEIQKTLEASVGHSLNLVYPSSGEYRSAIITNDIDFDGKFEVFSFYSTETDDKTTVMHINYIRWLNNKWVSVTDLQVDCSGVESVEFIKLDNSDTPKMVVNWDRYSSVNRQLSVYSIDSGELLEITKTFHSVYTTCDFDANGIFEIVALHLDTEKNTSKATLLALGENGFSDLGSCTLDGAVMSYYEPVVSKFTNGSTAVFVDANKSTGTITEVLYMKDNQLQSAIPYSVTNENIATLRASSVLSGDYDRDGCVDIPLAQKLPMTATHSPEDAAYLTVWNSFDGTSLYPIAYSVINYTDGYFLHIPENWLGSFAIERRLDTRQRIFYRWDSVLSEVGEEIMRIRAVSISEWNKHPDNYSDYTEIQRNGQDVIAVRYSTSALKPDETFVKEHLLLISQTDRATIKSNK